MAINPEELLSKNEIRNILVEHGYTEHIQPDGTIDLNSYVYTATYAAINTALGKIKNDSIE